MKLRRVSRLLLEGAAGAVQESEESEQWLRPEDIMKCESLSAQLVVLSACNSGRGQKDTGEGVVGLARALLARGVPTVVVALWPLPDSSTSTLMRTFYEVLCGEESVDVGDAMRKAMRKGGSTMLHTSD